MKQAACCGKLSPILKTILNSFSSTPAGEICNQAIYLIYRRVETGHGVPISAAISFVSVVAKFNSEHHAIWQGSLQLRDQLCREKENAERIQRIAKSARQP
jgi:hypothetical protein